MNRVPLRACLLLVLQISCAAQSTAADQAEAPFGLTWGSTVEDIKALGVDLKPSGDSNDFGESYVASRLPKSVSGQESTFLYFGHNNRLWRVLGASTPFENDPYGIAAKARYAELSAVLSEKYGKGNAVEQLGEGFYSKPDNFVYGISQGESHWFTKFEGPGVSITLGLFAQGSSALRWVLIYENKTLRATFEQDKKAREKGSL